MLVSYVKAIKITIKSVLLGRDRSNGTDFLMLWHLVTGLTRRRLGYKGGLLWTSTIRTFETGVCQHMKKQCKSGWICRKRLHSPGYYYECVTSKWIDCTSYGHLVK